jgi:Icc-related predicted phosphoesterase
LRTAGHVKEARRVIQERAAGREEEVKAEIGTRVVAQYESIFAALPDPTHLILGNVDNPQVVDNFVEQTPAVELVDGKTITLEGERFGFIGGALPTPLHVAGEITAEEMAAKVDSLGEVDVLCSHIPPDVPELCYDTLADKSEKGSKDLLRYIEEVQPRRHYFGHVHQPLLSSMHIGRTQCINVGYFRSTGKAWPHRRSDIP